RSNTSDLFAALTVSLLSTDTTELTVPATVVIPAGQASAVFTINVVDDVVTDGTQAVTIRATAAGYISIDDSLSVTDDDTNSPPVVDSFSLTTNEDTPKSGRGTASDLEGDPLLFMLVANATHGQVEFHPDGTFTYVPNFNFYGTDSFQYKAFDGRNDSNIATVTISVQPVNDPPVAVDDEYSLNEDQALTTSLPVQAVTNIQMTSDAGDWIGQGRSYNLSSGITASAFNNGSNVRVRYQNPNNSSDYWDFNFDSPNNNVPLTVGTYTGAVRYPFNPEGTPGLSVTGQGRGSNTLTGFFTIHDISMSANGQLRSFAASFEQHSEGSTPALRGTVQFNYAPGGPAGVLTNDTDVEGHALIAALNTQPQHGSVTLNPNGTFTYTPAANYNGSDFFTYVITDGLETSYPATVSLTVNSVQDAPTIANQSFTVPENQWPTASLGVVTASDGDPGQTVSYAITDSTHPGAFAIDPQTGELLLVDNSTLDFEQADRVILTVTATDNSSSALSSSALVTIHLTDANEAPRITTTSLSVNENAAVGASIGFVEAFDPDAGQTLTYQLLSNTGGALLINSATGELTVGGSAPFNFEITPTIEVFIGVSDGSFSTSSLVTIHINDVNEAPTLFAPVFNVDENAYDLTVVGVMYASDPDPGQTLTFSITSSTHPGAFAIDPSYGAIYVQSGALVNYETGPVATLMVTATDSGSPSQSTSFPVTVRLNDRNEAPVIQSQSFSVAENTAAGSVVGTAVASDEDLGQTLNYVLFGSSLPDAFAVDSATGQITVASASLLDYEAVQSVTLYIAAVDDGVPQQAGWAEFTINIANANDAPVIADQTVAIREYLNQGSTVADMIAFDQDPGQSLTFSIVSSSLPDAFMIMPATGRILVTNAFALDYETVGSATVIVRATDNGNPARSSDAIITVNITDVNESPMMSDQTFTIPENAATGTVVGTIIATDVDRNQTLAFTLLNSAVPGAFALDTATGQVTVANGALLDFETRSSIELGVLATDSGSPALATVAPITINITNVNEAPVAPGRSFTIIENASAGTSVGTITATDPDAGQSVTYAITGGNTGNAFAINAATGAITVNNPTALNFEATPAFNLTVTATDNGSPVRSSTAAVTIQLTDVNEVPVVNPVTLSVNENSANGTVVGAALASDPDAGQTLTYAITGGNTSNAFAINPTTGVITVNNAAALNFESLSTFNLTVTATDNGNPVRSSAATVTVNVLNVNESPTVTTAAFTISENSPSGQVIGTVAASDPDVGQTRTFAITGGNTNSAFAINPATGVITVSNSAALNFETTPLFNLSVTATDNGTPALSSSATVSVQLTNVNEAPMVSSATLAVNENSTSGTVVGTVTATDPDAGQTRAFAITGGNTNNAFTINSSTGVLTVNNAAALNFETAPSFSLTITVTDNGSPVRSGSAGVTVNVLNLNEAPTVNPASFTTNENRANGTAIGTVTASDPDAGQTRTFTITGGNTNGAFSIDPATGVLTVSNSAALNFETTPQFTLTVTATDNGSPARSGSATITVSLLNVNEAPVLPTQSFAVKTKSKAGTVVGTVTSSDPDAGQSRTYAIVSGNGPSNKPVFEINATTGRITVKTASSVTSSGQFTLGIRVTDNGSPSLSTTGTVTIYVNSSGTVPTAGRPGPKRKSEAPNVAFAQSIVVSKPLFDEPARTTTPVVVSQKLGERDSKPAMKSLAELLKRRT
ncbi:MAG TPA: cadherin domain-containing protein, partial [Planctomycetaceae bacterium]|nr:cadherin domain-containing protein [Planctomycetaceae bacterium]